MYGVAPEDHSAVIPRRTHRVSRQPGNFGFSDTSQFVDEISEAERTATQVMEANNTGRLLKGSHMGMPPNWISLPEAIDTWELPPPEEPVPDLEAEMRKHAEKAARAGQIPEGFDFTHEPPPIAARSLPMLHSRFAQPKALFRRLAKERKAGKPGSTAILQGFNARSKLNIVQSLKGLWYKPTPETLVHRRLEENGDDNSSAGSPTSHDWVLR